MGIKILVVIPTYNEAQNIEDIIRAVNSYLPTGGGGILIVDDNSPDGTSDIVRKLLPDFHSRLYLLERQGKQGVASAFLEGFAWGISNNFDACLAMDADFSHDPKYIPVMIDCLKDNDVVIGSRHICGGKISNRSVIRNVITKGASVYCRTILRCPIFDFTGGFNMWSRKALEKINVSSISTRGYSFQIELKFKAYQAKCKIIEIPIVFPDRIHGTSKMPSGFFFQALIDVWKIKFAIPEIVEELLKFLICGIFGSLVYLFIFFLFADVFYFSAVPVSIGCFVITNVQSYILNHRWSFRQQTKGNTLSIKKWLQYLLGSLLGLGINISIMTLLLRLFDFPLKVIAQSIGLLAGAIINFIVSRYIVFRKRS